MSAGAADGAAAAPGATAGGRATLDGPEDELSDEELLRYSRQIVLGDVGGSGQLRLRRARVAVVGAGGLGSPALLYLVAAGVGTVGVIDDDSVSLDNLARQVLFCSADVGLPKVEAAARRLRGLNPLVAVVPRRRRLDAESAAELLSGHHLVLDGSDNLATKFAVNDACVRLGIDAVIGAALGFAGQVVTVPRGAPCYRCLFGAEPGPGLVPSCRSAGVLGAVTGIVGALQASEALRLLLGAGKPQAEGRLLTVEALRGRVRTVGFPRDPGCSACAARPAEG